MNGQSIEENGKVKKNKRKRGCLIGVLVFVAFSIMIGLLNNYGVLEDDKKEGKGKAIKAGEDYETVVFQAFWEGASEFFEVEYSDYKMTHTAYSFVSESKTTDDYISYYYLINTAFETENVFGVKVLHKVTARCYYVPEYSNTVYTTYMTCDGERVYYDGEKESWLLGMES